MMILKPRLSSPRLKGYDYAQAGVYFVTICTQGRLLLFGNIVDPTMEPSPAGAMIEAWWLRLPDKFPLISLDEFIVMPNHLHGIVGFDTAAAHSLSEVMAWFKTMTTNAYIRGVKMEQWPTFPGKLWQRSYYDHIVRHEKALDQIRQYIMTNPTRWEYDRHNPEFP